MQSTPIRKTFHRNLYITPVSVFDMYRVEGKGKAVITDVIYSNKVTEVKQPSPAGSKEEQNAIKVSAYAESCPVHSLS